MLQGVILVPVKRLAGGSVPTTRASPRFPERRMQVPVRTCERLWFDACAGY